MVLSQYTVSENEMSPSRCGSVIFYAFLPCILGFQGVCVGDYRIGRVRRLLTFGGAMRVYTLGGRNDFKVFPSTLEINRLDR